MPKLTEDQQKQRRARILDAAEACFAANGFHRTTMQDICKSAGISAGALYIYFDSKEGLIEGLSGRDRAEIIEKFAALEESADFFEGLQTVMRTTLVEQPPHKARLFMEMGAEGSRNPAIGKILADCDATIRASLAHVLQRAKDEGRISPALPVARVAEIMAVIADGVFWRRAAVPGFDLAAAAPDLLALMAGLVGLNETPASPGKEGTK